MFGSATSRMAWIALAAVTSTVTAQQLTQAAQDKVVRLNEIQVIGSHNSYHSGFAPSERKYLEMKNPKALRALDYSHAPLPDQLNGGVRQIEIDVFADAKGGHYAHLPIDDAEVKAGLPADPNFDPNHEMDKPGFKVMHVQGVDQRSTCHTFVKCMMVVREWSQQHPQHLPIFILVETKDDGGKPRPGMPATEPFTPQVFDALDAEVRSVFKPGEYITPDEVRGHSATLIDAIGKGGWPTLAKARGRVIFLLDQRKVEGIYTENHPSLKGRVFFTNAEPGKPDAAFTEQNNGSKETIDALVKQGYLVRTRTDEGTEQARTNDTTRRDLALSTGAQMISTDYPPSEPSKWTSFVVKFPDDLVARCNPVNKPGGCVDSLLEPSASAMAKK
ncbi:phosphatidylinositol-specific phospholipase C1-like protein [Edaphobacter sp. 12200R-103]|uniref:phosphatidylinositol-specific phospholipase C1-like protein n=1 Tax=Edaphobacter sp. 12200R-103 TaxID=2703788 RepID=UPI001EE46DE3|nr:phosphatidylinositol-specific phospholipase C1-like protein [Edaphobacter sp. 12200R-103]